LRDPSQVLLYAFLLEHPCDFRRLGGDGVDRLAVRAYGLVHVAEKWPERNGVDVLKGALQQSRGNLEINEIVIIVRSVPLLGDLEDVKAELRSLVRRQRRGRAVSAGLR